MTTKHVRFVLNRKNFREQVLQGHGTKALLEEVARNAAGDGATVEVDESGPRARARVVGSLADEAALGSLSRTIGRMRL